MAICPKEDIMKLKSVEPYTSTTNACKLCRPMGACIAFRGIEGAVPFLHGSQGCATYMRRYIISHFNEPIDIASSSLGEKNAIFGGGPNLKQGLRNVTDKYAPRLIGIATTCLTETIGDDVAMFLKEYQHEAEDCAALPLFVNVSTPSYAGSHMEGFHGAVRATIVRLAEETATGTGINLLPGLLSTADIRHLREIVEDFGLAATILPDYSETLDGMNLHDYPMIPGGGTPVEEIGGMGGATATIEFGRTIPAELSGGSYLHETQRVPLHRLGIPVGIGETDRFFKVLEELSGSKMPQKYGAERGRLVDAYVDGHKYVSGKKAVVYGEEDLVVGLTAFLCEIGIEPVICATGGNSGKLATAIQESAGAGTIDPARVSEDVDFHEIAELAAAAKPDIIIGHSKGYQLSRQLQIPLVRLGFPIHDRIGGQRILHVGYRGAQQLFDLIVNTLIEHKQDSSGIGYSYM
jgi:nitrogenase molybdenum-iron protein NifN